MPPLPRTEIPRPIIRRPDLLKRGIHIPPLKGQLGYIDDDNYSNEPTWHINGSCASCHYSAPKWYYPGTSSRFVGVITSVDDKIPPSD